jgi:hypothetical protein
MAPDGGGVVLQPNVPIEQSEVATGWTVELESAITGQVYISAKFIDVT